MKKTGCDAPFLKMSLLYALTIRKEGEEDLEERMRPGIEINISIAF